MFLTPEVKSNRSPFVISLFFQVTLLTLILIPWAAHVLPIQTIIPSVPIIFRQPPPEVVEQQHTTTSTTQSSGPTVVQTRRVFRVPTANAPLDNTNITISDAPPVTGDVAYSFGNVDQTIPGLSTGQLTNIGIAPGPTVVAAKPSQITVGGRVQEAKLIQKILPIYPALAKQARIQGVVTLAAVIAKDGTIKELHVMSGHPLLTSEAMKAVAQWRYRPTELNGSPVEVQTTIDVRFTLSQ